MDHSVEIQVAGLYTIHRLIEAQRAVRSSTFVIVAASAPTAEPAVR